MKDGRNDDDGLASAETERVVLGSATSDEPRAKLDVRAPELAPIDGAERYERGPLLGRGGMGAVHLDRDRRIGRRVARKMLGGVESVEAVRRFLREARIQGQLEHPAIPPVYDVGRAPTGEVYFTMKRLRGVTLGEILKGLARGDEALRARYPRRRLLTALLTVCDALDYAHARGVLHRDLKPANVMLGEYGEVWVLDWGIARVLGEPAEPTRDDDEREPPSGMAEVSHGRLTQPGSVLGTLHYISPEQLRDQPLDGRTDVYSLGMMLFEILVLRPFRTESDWMRVLGQLTEGKAARPSDIDPSIEPELDRIVERATAPDPADRTIGVRELRSALDAFLSGERDADARAESARRIVAGARRRLENTQAGAPGARATVSIARADAMHEALRALAVDPQSREADQFVAELVENVTDEPPPAAEVELQRARDHLRHEGMHTARAGLMSWVLPIPLIVMDGVRDWPAFFVGVGLLFLGIGLTTARIWAGRTRSYDGVLLALVVAALLVVVSGYLGPFVVVPTCANAAAMVFAMHGTKTERLVIAVILCAGALAPFAIDASGLVPPGFEFVGDTIVLHPRLVEIPPTTTIAGFVWVSCSFTIVSVFIVGRMRNRLDAAERRLHLSVWHLRQLFPSAAPASPG